MPENVDKVKPRLSKGLNDLLPAQMLARQSMVDTIRGVYENYGFVPLSTPAIEYMDVLRGTSDTQKKIFGVVSPEKEDLGLRYDLTVPLARVFAMNRDMPRPFRRYQVSPVWRPDKPDKGRFREFTQFDLDSVGVVSEIADTEILAGMCDTLEALKVGGYSVRYSSRALLNLLLTYAEIPHAQGAEVFRVLDKMDKAGPKKVRLELTAGYVDSSGDPIPGLGLSEGQVDRIDRFLAIRSADRREVIGQVRELFQGIEGAEGEIVVVEKISNHLYALGYGDERVGLDLSIARGLDYYTGPVFESSLLDAPQFGSVFSGGRYDDLVTRFLGEKVPAVGSSVGVDRLLSALEHLGRNDQRRATAHVLVVNMDAELASEYVAMTWELRRAGIPTELYLGTQKSPGKQLKYADYYDIPVVVLVGSNEKERGVVTLKDMVVGREKAAALAERRDWLEARPGQREVPRADLVSAVRNLLAEIAAPVSPLSGEGSAR